MESSNARTITSLQPPHASLPFQFWLEAISTATYLINLFPTKTLHMQSPYQKLYNKSPSFLHLKTFRCLCYPWTAYTRTHKLDSKSPPCIFLGYSTDHKCFCCFDPTTSKLFISRHVRFHEHEFPMATQSPIPQSPQISTIHNPLPPPLLPTFYPQPTISPSSPNQPPTKPSTIPPPHHSDTHIQYQRRRPQPNTLPTSTLPPLLPLPAPTPTTTHPHHPPPNNPPPDNPKPTKPSTIPPPHHSDTHIQYQRRRPQPNTLPTSTLPPLLPLPAPTPTTTHPLHPTTIYPPHDNPIPTNHSHNFP